MTKLILLRTTESRLRTLTPLGIIYLLNAMNSNYAFSIERISALHFSPDCNGIPAAAAG